VTRLHSSSRRVPAGGVEARTVHGLSAILRAREKFREPKEEVAATGRFVYARAEASRGSKRIRLRKGVSEHACKPS
jgi:hypothetical protein